jgi:four helix bundle protein
MIAYGSLREVETQLLISNRLSYLPKEVVDQLLENTSEIGRLIDGLKRSLK